MDSLVSSLSFSESKDGAQLSCVEAITKKTQIESLLPQKELDRTEDTKEQNDSNSSGLDGQELIPIAQQLPPNQIPSHRTIFINELKLSHFKQFLVKNGIQAEFSERVLYNNDNVEVKRSEGPKHLEGTLSQD